MEQFVIKKGNHYANGEFFRIFDPNYYHYNIVSFYGTFQFMDGSWYSKVGENSSDKNKLVGLGFGLNHHKNSVRFAWIPNYNKVGKIEIWAYWYDENDNQRKFLCEIEQYEIISYTILIYCTFYFLKIGNNIEFKIENNNKDKHFGKVLVPYFGGDLVAHQDIHINLGFNKVK